jgi:Helix-turn-helix domain
MNSQTEAISGSLPEDLLESPKSVAFIHGFLDEYGLDPYEFRIYAHIVRRTGGKTKGVCFASISNISKICKISPRKTQQIIKTLLMFNFITQNKRVGRTDEYRVNASSEWASREDLIELRDDLKKSQQKDSSSDFIIEGDIF